MSPYREAPSPTRTCPRCTTGLRRRALADAYIEECLQCAGFFVSTELIPRVVDALDLGGEVISTFPPGAPELPTGSPTYLKCPRCSDIMNRKLFASGAKVVVDVCSQHGIWFDDAELRAVAMFAAGGGMERAASRDAAERAHRAAQAKRPRETSNLAPMSTAELERATLLEILWNVFTFW
jgi:Zn-finger nucleic acid-binding protein